MTQEEKSLLLKDLCARLPYGVICVGVTYDLDDDGERYIPVKVRNILTEINNYTLETASVKLDLISSCRLETIKPYLRPMSSMTEDERKEIEELIKCHRPSPYGVINNKGVDNLLISVSITSSYLLDGLNAHHFDYRGLIPMGLALEAPEGMYKTK